MKKKKKANTNQTSTSRIRIKNGFALLISIKILHILNGRLFFERGIRIMYSHGV